MSARAAGGASMGRSRWLLDAGRAGLVLLTSLAALGTVLAAGRFVPLGPQVAVLAVVLCVVLARTAERGARMGPAVAVELAVLSVAAGGVGWLLLHEPAVGRPLLVAGLTVGILARRYGPAVQRVGRLVTLPFLALLITPVPPGPAGHAVGTIASGAGAALVAVAWTAAAERLARWLRGPGSDVVAGGEEAARPVPAARSGRRLDAPTRMGAQMAAGLAAAMLAGSVLFGEHWVWTVLSAYLVASGTRGRGDVLHKAGLRVAGAVFGTGLATVVAGRVVPGDRVALVLLFAVLGLALALRPRSYAFWAAGVTAVVALLQGYYGQSGSGLLVERLAGVLLGAVLGAAAAWWVLPVRTADVLRRRLADCLAALTDDLAEPADGVARRQLPASLVRLEELLPTLRAQALVGRVLHRGPQPAPLAAVQALQELAAALPVDERERRRLRGATVRVRRALVGKDAPSPEELPWPMATVHVVLQATARPAKPLR